RPTPGTRLQPRRLPGLAVQPRDPDTTEQAGAGVVRVPLEPGGQLQHRVPVQRSARQPVRGGRTRHHRGRRRAQTAGVRDGVRAGQAQAGDLEPELVRGVPHGPHHEMVLVPRKLVRTARPGVDDVDVQAVVDDLRLDHVVERQRHPDRVEPRAEVRGGCRNANSHRAHDRSKAFATASASTGSASIRAAELLSAHPVSAVSGSFRPCPVTVQTTNEPRGRRPSSATFSNPATPVADAGSTNTPSQAASGRWAARVWSSVTASNSPPDSSRAATAPVQDAGLPTRIAVATVSGFATGSPRTSGDAPAAWKPNIRGVLSTTPSLAYSV